MSAISVNVNVDDTECTKDSTASIVCLTDSYVTPETDGTILVGNTRTTGEHLRLTHLLWLEDRCKCTNVSLRFPRAELHTCTRLLALLSCKKIVRCAKEAEVSELHATRSIAIVVPACKCERSTAGTHLLHARIVCPIAASVKFDACAYVAPVLRRALIVVAARVPLQAFYRLFVARSHTYSRDHRPLVYRDSTGLKARK